MAVAFLHLGPYNGLMKRPINNQWHYDDGKTSQVVDIPHGTVLEQGYFDEKRLWHDCVYSKTLDCPALDHGRRLFIAFDGVSSMARVLCNGVELGVHKGAYDGFEFEIKDPSPTLEIRVEVSSYEDPSIPPFGGQMDYLSFDGIYRPVFLIDRPESYIQAVRIDASLDGSVRARIKACGRVDVKAISLADPEGRPVDAAFSLKDSGSYIEAVSSIPSPKAWNLASPALYSLRISYDGDIYESAFGFRDARFKADGFYLNGERLKLIGLDRHQCYPRSGYAMPQTPQRLDARRLKDLGCNIVRTSHYMQSPYFLDECDRIGLLVLEEIPGWQYTSKSQEWRDLVVGNVNAMIERDFNHPSIVLWNIRINEGKDDDQLYERTSSAAKALDCVRQTGGTRNFPFSHLLEDVYTYNDFHHDGTNKGLMKPSSVTRQGNPILVTEHNGHMFSTKTYDDALHREGQVLRHARVLNDMLASPRVSGAIGWCFADYNTHSNFGSGDGNCYHGVTDAFRNPKDAAWLYKSQKDDESVLHVVTRMDCGDWAKTYMSSAMILTNADCVKISTRENSGNAKGEQDDETWEDLGIFYPDRESFPALPHPPIIARSLYESRLRKVFTKPKDARLAAMLIDKVKSTSSITALLPYALRITDLLRRYHLTQDELMEIGKKASAFGWKRKASWRFEAIKDGKTAGIQVIENTRPRLSLRTDTTTISSAGDTFDVVQVDIEALVEGMHNPLPYCFEPIELELTGPMELYATSSLLSLQAGRAAAYLRTAGKAGTATLKAFSPSLGEGSISINVI